MKQVVFNKITGKIRYHITRNDILPPSQLAPEEKQAGLSIVTIPPDMDFDPLADFIYVDDNSNYVSASRHSLPGGIATSSFYKPAVLPPYEYKPILPIKGQIKALIVRFIGIGDVIMSLGAIYSLHKTYPDWHITYVTKYPLLLQRLNFIHQVIYMDYNHPKTGYPELPIDLPAAHTVFNLINKVDFGKMVSQRARADNFAKIMNVKIPKDYQTPVLPLTTSEISWAMDTLWGNGILSEDIKIACQLDSFGDCKFWHLERWQELADAMPEAKFIWFSLSEAHKHIKVPKNVLNTACGLSLQECIALLGACDIIVCPDSSFMHLGCMLRIPVIILSGSTKVEYHTKYHTKQYPIWAEPRLPCSPCGDWQLRNDCYNDKVNRPWCLQRIESKQVAEMIIKILDKKETIVDELKLPDNALETLSAKESKQSYQKTVESFTGSIALMRLDGLGGTVTLSDQVKKIYEKFNTRVSLIIRGYETLFEGNPYIDRIINVGERDWRECSMIYRGHYDVFGDIRFAMGKWFLSNTKFVEHFQQQFNEVEDLFRTFPQHSYLLNRYNLHHIQLTDKLFNLPYETIESEVFVDEHIDISDNFILISNGVDIVHKSLRQTKCWDGWNDLITQVELKTVQVGTIHDPLVEGVFDLRGKTNLKQLVYLIKKARCIIATEGGIMHLAYASKNPNVIIIGGPTQGVLFEYPGHTWITSHACNGCLYLTEDWFIKCPKQVNAVCMKTIPIERVLQVVAQKIN